MTEARMWPAIATADDVIFVAGEYRWSHGSHVIATAECFSVHCGQWTMLDQVMGVPRAGAGMVLSHGQLLVFGGLTWNHYLKTLQALEDVEV